ncbi:MAG: hypothetical protein Q9205_006335 [Flavoplaca limonia]
MSGSDMVGLDDESLHPQILSTCRLVFGEAGRILYERNAFSIENFGVRRHMYDPNNFYDELDASRAETQTTCANLMSYNIFAWDRIVHPLVRNSVLAAFLVKIGPYNASRIRNFRFSCTDTNQFTDDIDFASMLCAQHMPGVKTVGLYFREEPIAWEEICDYCFSKNSPPHSAQVLFEPKRKSLTNLFKIITWLQVFPWDAEGKMCIEESDPLPGLKQFETFAKERNRRMKLQLGNT